MSPLDDRAYPLARVCQAATNSNCRGTRVGPLPETSPGSPPSTSRISMCSVDRSNAGKTTALEKLIPELVRRGYPVGTVSSGAGSDTEPEVVVRVGKARRDHAVGADRIRHQRLAKGACPRSAQS